MHRLLKRQLKRNLGSLDAIPKDWEKFLNAVSDAYDQADDDRRMLERTIELNSQELLELNSQIRAAIPDTFLRLDKQGIILDYKAGQNQNNYLPSSKVIGQQLQTFLPIAVGQKFLNAIESLDQQTASEISIVHDLVREDHKYYYEVRLLPLLGNQVVAIVRDITERKQAEAALNQSQLKLQEKTHRLATILADLKNTQAQLVQTEKMSGLGQLVAGIAHEINNPVNFVSGNISHVYNYVCDLVELLTLYQSHYPEPVEVIQDYIQDIDLAFLLEDLENIQGSMQVGVDRIIDIVRSLRTFSRLDEADMKAVDIHAGIESTLLILNHRLKANGDFSEIEVQKHYGNLPLVECYAGQLNQVFMNVIANAIDALVEHGMQKSLLDEEKGGQSPKIIIRTKILKQGWILIGIANNGPNISNQIRDKLFDPFFTTKPVGDGTGLGLSISYQIVTDRHGGQLWCHSDPGKNTEFGIEIPINQSG